MTQLTEDLAFAIIALRQQIATLTAERDEARREVCKLTGGWITKYGQEPQRLAAERGWDCFKEDGK